jgi:hypothetical protein
VSVLRCLLFGAAAGLNPWLALLIAAGLATFSPRVVLAPPLSALTGTGAVLALGALMGVDVVLGKLRPAARALAWIDLAIGIAAGAAAGVSFPGGSAAAAAAGAAGALAGAAARFWAVRALNRPLWGFGHVGAVIAADLLASIGAALVFMLRA